MEVTVGQGSTVNLYLLLLKSPASLHDDEVIVL